jgi:hypothetical protein
MAQQIFNIANGDIYKRLEGEMHIFANVNNKDDIVEMVQAEIINGELIRFDTYGMRYKKVC